MDFEESIAMSAIIRKAIELHREDMEYLAEQIRDQIVDAWNKGQK